MSDNNAQAMAGASTENTTDPPDTPEAAELEADIARTREELAETVDQLAAKLDVKTRIRNRASETKNAAAAQAQSVRHHVIGVDGKPRPAALAAAGGVAAAVATVVLVRWWMRPSRRRTRGRRR